MTWKLLEPIVRSLAPMLQQPGMILMSLTILEMEIGLSATFGHAMIPENSDGDRVLSQLSAVADPRFWSCVAVEIHCAYGKLERFFVTILPSTRDYTLQHSWVWLIMPIFVFGQDVSNALCFLKRGRDLWLEDGVTHIGRDKGLELWNGEACIHDKSIQEYARVHVGAKN